MRCAKLGFVLAAVCASAVVYGTGASSEPLAPPPRPVPPAQEVPSKEGAGGRKAPPVADLDRLEVRAKNVVLARKDAERDAKRGIKRPTVNGVVFEVRASVEHKFEGDVIVLDWSLDYDGRRAPLVVLGPTLDNWRTLGATKVKLYAAPAGEGVAWSVQFSGLEGREGKPVHIGGPPRLGVDDSLTTPKELFLTVWPGKPATGALRVPAARLRQRLADSGAAHAFDPKIPPRVFAEVTHAPDDRGQAHELDAWTGELTSDILKVPALKAW